MLVLKAKTPEELYKKAFLEVYELPDLEGDPKNYRDTPAVLSLVNYTPDNNIGVSEKGFYSSFDYTKYVEGGNAQMDIEIEHYDKELIKSGKLKEFVRYFRSDLYTKRGLVCLWENHRFNKSRPFPCLVYVWLRRVQNVLHMNCHMRANNAYKILLMDLHIGISLHAYMSKKFNLSIGNYNHIIDSLHFYKDEKSQIEKLYNKLTYD